MFGKGVMMTKIQNEHKQQKLIKKKTKKKIRGRHHVLIARLSRRITFKQLIELR